MTKLGGDVSRQFGPVHGQVCDRQVGDDGLWSQVGHGDQRHGFEKVKAKVT